MKLYHGTVSSSALNIINEGINLKCSQELLDFGRGFYTTPNKEHAKSRTTSPAGGLLLVLLDQCYFSA